MADAEGDAREVKPLPNGFLFIRFDLLLNLLGSTIATVWMIAANPRQEYTAYILGPVILVLLVCSFVARRQVRRFVREHGEVEIRFVYSPHVKRPKKNILFREVGEMIDAGIDRVLDGKEPGSS